MAAGQSVQVTLGFRADTSGAKQAIQELNAQLNKLQDLNTDNLHINRDLAEAANAAKILQQNLQAAFNVKTGQIDMTKFSTSLRQAGTSVTQLGQQLINAGNSGTTAFASLGRTIAAMDVPLKQTNATVKNMMTTLKNTAKWQISSNLIHGIQSAFTGALQYARELNQSLTDIRIVSGASVAEMSKFATEANKAAKSLGTTTKSYADAAKLFYQQGDTPEQAAKKAEITLKATNAAFKASASEMSEYLTAVWNSYQAGTDQLQGMVDVMAALGATTATSMEEIATSLQKVAATANNVGVSMEQMSSMIATISSATRLSAETVGTSMNTVLARMGSLKLGETLEDGVNLTKYTSALKSVGVEVLNTSGQMRSMGTIIEELGAKWQTMSKAQQTALANTIGGARQYTNLMALFSNWDKYQQNMQTALNSGGALDQMQEKYMQGWEGASKKLKASLESVYSALINDQGIIKFTNGLSGVVDQVSNLITSFGGLSGILTQFGSIAVQVFSNNIGASITGVINKISTFKQSFQDLNFLGTDRRTWTKWDAMKNFGIGLITKTTDERVYLQQAQAAQTQLKNARDVGDVGLQAQINASQTLLEKKIALQNAEASMTDVQKRNAQAELASLTAQASEIDRLSDAYREANSVMQQRERGLLSISNLQKAAANEGVDQRIKNAANDPTALRSAYNSTVVDALSDFATRQALTGGGFLKELDPDKIAQAGNGLSVFMQRYVQLNQASTALETSSGAVSSALIKVGQIAASEGASGLETLTDRTEAAQSTINLLVADLKTTSGEMAKKGFDTTSLDNWIQKLEQASSSGNLSQMQNALQNAQSAIDGFSTSVTAGANVALNILASRMGMSKDELLAFAAECGVTEEALLRIAQRMGAFNSSADGFTAKVSNLQKNISNFTRAIGAMGGAFSSAFNMMANWNEASVSSRVMGITSTLTQGINSIMAGAMAGSVAGPAGTIVGALAGLGTTIAGVVTGYNERLEKERIALQEKNIKSGTNAASESTSEITNIRSLISEYNSLYETYLQTGSGQEELVASAQKLADTYGIVGGALAVLRGDFEGFNDLIANGGLDLTKVFDQYQDELENIKTTLTEIISSGKDMQPVRLTGSDRVDLYASTMGAQTELNQLKLTDSNVMALAYSQAAHGTAGSYDFMLDNLIDYLWKNGLKNNKEAKQFISEQLNGYDWEGSNRDARQTMVRDFAATPNLLWDTFITAAQMYLRDVDLTVGKVKRDENFGYMSSALVGATGLGGVPTLSAEQQAKLLIDAGIGVNDSDLQFLDLAAGHGKYAHLVEKRGVETQLKWNPQTAEEAIALYQEYLDYEGYLRGLLNDYAQDSDEYKALKNQLNAVQQITQNEQFKSAMAPYQTLIQNVREAEIAQSTLLSAFGHNEENATFSSFLEYQKTARQAVEDNIASFSELSDYIDFDPNKTEEEIAAMNPIDAAAYRTKLKQYNLAVDAVTKKLITNYTGFDDYLQMAQALSESLQDYDGAFEQVTGFIDKRKIKTMSSTTISAISHLYATQSGFDINKTEKDYREEAAALLAQGSTKDSEEYKQLIERAEQANLIDELLAADAQSSYESKYNQYITGQSSLKKNMSREDTEAVYKAFFEEGNGVNGDTTWEQFIAKNYEERSKWIQEQVDKAKGEDLANAQSLLKTFEQVRDDWKATAFKGQDQQFTALSNHFTELKEQYSNFSQWWNEQVSQITEGENKGKYQLAENAPDWLKDAFEGKEIFDSMPDMSEHFGTWLTHEFANGTENNPIFTKEELADLTNGTYTFEELVNAYSVWMSLDAQAQSQTSIIKILEGMGTAADTAIDKISRLASAMSKLPTTEEEMTKLLTSINGIDPQHTIYENETIVNGSAQGLYTSTGRLIAHDSHKAYTAKDLQSMFHNDQAAYQELLIEAMEAESDGSVQALEQIYQAKLTQAQNLAQNTAALSTGGISLSDDLSQLQNALSALQSIDITSVPQKGTEAYNALGEAIKHSGESIDQAMQRFANMDEFTRNSTLYQAINSNLGDQKTNVEQQAEAWANAFKDFNGGEYDFAAMYRGEQALPTDPNVLAAYEKYVGYLRQGAEYEAQIASNSEKEATARTNIYTTQAKQTQARQQTALTEANKQVNAAQLLLNNTNGNLTAAQRQQLSAANIDTSAYDRATTAATRASAASQIYAQAIEAVKVAYQEQNANIDEFLNHGHQAEVWLNGYGKSVNKYLATTSNGARSMFESMGFSEDAIEQAMQAYNDLVSQGKITATTTNEQVLSLVTNALSNTKTTNTQAWQAYQATAIDAIKSVYSNMATEAQQAAANQISIWQSTFSTIANLMKAALGGTLFQEVTSSWDNYLQAYLNSSYYQNHDTTGFSSALRNGSFKSSDFILPTYNSDAILTSLGLGNNGLFDTTEGSSTFGELRSYTDVLEAGRQLAIDRGLTDTAQIEAAAESYTTEWMDILLQQAFSDEAIKAMYPDSTETAETIRAQLRDSWKNGTLTTDQQAIIKNARTDLIALAQQYGVDLNTATTLSNISTARQGVASRAQAGSTASAYQSQASSAQNIIGQIISAMEGGDTYDQAIARLGLSPEQITSLTQGANGQQFTLTSPANSLAYWKEAWGKQSTEEANQYNQTIAEAEAALSDAEIERQLITGTYKDKDTGEVLRTATLSDGTVITYDEAYDFVGNDNERVKELDREIAGKRAQIGVRRTGTTYDASQVENAVQQTARLTSAFSGLPTSAKDINKLVDLTEYTSAEELIQAYNTNRADYYDKIIAGLNTQIESGQLTGADLELATQQLAQFKATARDWDISQTITTAQRELTNLKTVAQDLNSIDFATLPTLGTEAYTRFATALGLTSEELSKLTEEQFLNQKYSKIKENLEAQKQQAEAMRDSYISTDAIADYGIDFSTVTEDQIASFTDAQRAAYENYLNYVQQVAEYDTQIQDNESARLKAQKDLETARRNNRESSKIEKWNEELEEFNKKSEKAKNVYEALSGAIESGQLTKAQRSNFAKDSPLITMWDSATTAAQRAKIAMAAAYEATSNQQAALDKQIAATKKFNNTTYNSKAYTYITSGQNAGHAQANWEDESSFIENIFGKNLSGAETAILSQAYQATIKLVPEWQTDPSKFMAEFYNQLSSLNGEYTEQQNELMNQLADNINNLYANLGSQEQSAAQAAVQAWTSAFNQIKSIRQSLFSGGSAMELIAGSPEQAIAMWQQYAAYQAKNGKTATVQDMLTAAGNGQLTADMFTYGTAESYLSNARKQYGIDYVTWTDRAIGQTHYGNGASFDNSMRRAATALGMTYDANAGNVSWNAEKQAFNIEGKDETFTAAQLIEQAQAGNLSIGREAMTAYLTPFWSNALQQVTNEATGQNYTAQEATDLITAAMTKGQGSDEWDTLSTALGTVDGGLQAFATALQAATAASEALTRAQQHATEQERIAQKSTRISSALASYAENSQGMSWEQYAQMQGLTDAEIAEAGNVTTANARGFSYKQSRAAEAAYNSAAKKYREEAAALLVENGGDYTAESVEYQNMIRAAEQQEQQAASERGKRMSDQQTRMNEIRARILRTREREAERLNTGAAANTMQDAYGDYYRTGVMSAEVQQALLKAGIDPSTITGRDSYKSTMEQLKANNAQYMEMQKKNAALYALQQTGRSTINFDNVTSTTDYEAWLDSLSYVDRIWAENDSSMQTYFNNYRQSLIEAETAQAGLSTAAIEMGINIEAATARATKETEKLTKKYTQLEGLSDSLTDKVQTGKINNATRQKLMQAGLSQNWDAATTIAQRAKVIAQAQVQTATAQIDMLTRQNKGALEIDDFFNSENFNSDKMARTMPATKMARAFKENFTAELQNTKGDVNKAFDNILSMDAFNSFSDEAKAKMREIFSDIASTMDANASPTEYWEKFIQACAEAGDDAKETIASVTTELFDNWSSVMSSIIAEEQAAAQQIIAIWEAAFATIAALHEAAFSGKSLESGLDSIDDFIEAFLLSGATSYEQFDSWLQQRGTAAQAAVDQLTLPQTTAKEIATSVSGLAAYANWTSANQLSDYSAGGTRTQAEAIEAFKTDVISNLTSDWDNLDAEAFGLTKLDNGSYQRTVTREDGTTYTQTFNAAQQLLDLFTDRDWQKAYAAAAGGGQAYYTKQMHQQSEQFMREQMTGGALPYQMTLSNGTTASTLTELQEAYNRQWQESDAELLTKAIQTPVNKWLAGQGEAFTQTELDRLKALGVTDTESARAAKENYNADTALVNAAQVSVASAVITTDLVQLPDGSGSYVDTNTARGRELQEGEEAGLGEAEYITLDDGKRYAGRVITAESYETLSDELQTITETANAATSALVPGFEDALNGVAERLGVTRSELGGYVEDLAALEGITLDWMSLTADEQVMMGQAAEEWTKASDAITALSNALTEKTGAFAIIEDTTKSITEQRAAYETLRDAVNDYFRDAEVGLDFVKDKENMELIKKWAEGSTEAMEQLEAKILEQQLAKMFKELGNEIDDAGDAAKEFNKIANGLKFGQKLSGQKGAIPALIKLQKQLGLTNKQMSELLDTMGVTSNWGEKAAQSANDFVKQFDDGSGDIEAAMAMANEQLAGLGMQVQQVGDDFVYCAKSAEGVQIDASNLDMSTLEAISAAYAEQGIEIPVSYMVENPDAITAILNQDGTITYTVIPPAEPEMEEQTGENAFNLDGSGQAIVGVPGGGTTTAPASVSLSGSGSTVLTVPKFEGTGNRPGGGGGGKKPSGGGGGGGGGSKKKKYEKKKRTDDSSDRYHEVTKQLDHMQNKLDKIDKIKSATWGKDHLKAINDEIAAIKEENQVQQEYLEEAQAYYNQHKQMLESMGAIIDENGVITNYEELMDQWTAEYNAAVDQYNNLTAEQQEKESSKAAINEATETYEQRMQLLEEFEEDASLLETIQNDILENQNKISAAIAEGITYKIEFQFDYDERELAALDQWITRYESKLAHQDDTWEKLKKKQDIYFTVDDKGRLNGGELYYLQEQYAELQRQYNNGKGDLNAADYAELLKDLEERIRDTVTNIEELRQQMSELYGSTIDLAKEELSKYTDQIDHMVSSAESLVELQGLMGHGDSASAVLGLYETQYRASEANLQQSRTWMETIRTQRDQIQAQYDAQVAALGDNATAEQLEEINQLYGPMLDKANEELMEAEDAFYENWQATAEKAQALFEKQVDAAIEKFDEAISSFTGTDFDFDDLESDYEYYTEVQERYVSTSKELYEISKLNRQINQSISDATTKQSKERLKLLQQEINDMSEKNQLTEYDIEMMQLQYKHALALQELEEKQNAKSVVRLTRDENGNYGYQYTADESDINDARQKVEDALQEINELSANRVAELEQEWISSEREYRDKLKEIAADTSLTVEEREAKMAELTQQHQERMLFLQQQYGNASEALLTNQQHVQERYGQTILENTGMIQDQMNSLAGLALLASGDYAAYLQEQMTEGGSLWQALHEHMDNLDSVAAAAGTTWEDATTGASDYADTLNDLQTTLSQTNQTMVATTKNILDYVAAWTQSEGVMQTLLNDAEALAEAMRGEIGDENDDVQGTGVGAEGPSGANQKHYMYAWGYRGWFGDQAGYDSSTAAKAAAYNDIEAFFEDLKMTEDSEDPNSATTNAKYEAYIAQAKKTVSVTKYATGGLVDYTGPAWVDGTISQPELMLNPSDTQKILQAVDFVRMLDDGTLADIQAAIAQNTMNMLYTLGAINAPSTHYKPEELQQNVQITAEFPNATDHNEISQAFDDLINLATQYAYRK